MATSDTARSSSPTPAPTAAQTPASTAAQTPAPTPAFAGATIDRVMELRADRDEIERLLRHPRAAVLGASADSVLIADVPQPRLLRRPVAGHVNPYQPILLGLDDGEPLFAADLDDPEAETQLSETGTGRLVSLREAGLLLPQPEGGVAAYLVALLNWHRRHRFCANCGARTRVSEAGLSRRCPSCSQTHFPRTDPVVIMLVDDGAGHLLLGRRIGWAEGRFSILAGYVAPGETPEAAVKREVLEESGVRAHSPRYVASQPWPFPASLMLGYEASAQRAEPSHQPVPQPGEMVEVRWFSLDEVRDAARRSDGRGVTGAPATGLQLPGEVSIARMLIDAWVARGGRRA
jgi:NAD+ diphosphatase